MTIPLAPWTLQCPWCPWSLVVHGRGGRGADEGSGVEAARLGQRHAEEAHGETWASFLTPEPISAETHRALIQALTVKHREELMESRALNVIYRAMLEAASLPVPPDEDGAEALRRIRAVFQNAGLGGDPEQAHDLTDDWSGIFAARPPDPDSHDPLVRAWHSKPLAPPENPSNRTRY